MTIGSGALSVAPFILKWSNLTTFASGIPHGRSAAFFVPQKIDF